MMPLPAPPFIDNFDIHSNYSDSIIAQNALYNNSNNNKIISKSISTRNVSTSTTMTPAATTMLTPKKISSKSKTIRSNSVQIKSDNDSLILKEQRNLSSGRSIQSLCSCDADTEVYIKIYL